MILNFHVSPVTTFAIQVLLTYGSMANSLVRILWLLISAEKPNAILCPLPIEYVVLLLIFHSLHTKSISPECRDNNEHDYFFHPFATHYSQVN